MREITDSDFYGILASSRTKPVVVDLYAPWCGPCQRLTPALDKLSEEYKDKVEFVKMNVDDNPLTVGEYYVRSVPTVLIVKDGTVTERLVGANLQPIIDALR